MEYTYPVPWHRDAKGSIELCRKPKRCKLPAADHVDAVSAYEAEHKFAKCAAIHGERITKAYYLDVTATGAGLRTDAYVASARDFAHKMAAYEQQHGKPLDQIALQGTVQLFDGIEPIQVERSFRRGDNGAERARWTLTRTGAQGVVQQRAFPYSAMVQHSRLDNVRLFLDYDTSVLEDPDGGGDGMNFALTRDEDPALAHARRHDTLTFLYELLATVEAQAALSTHALRNDLIATDSSNVSCLLHKDEAGYASGSVDYAQSGWRPEFLRNADVGEDEIANVRAAYSRVELYTNSRRRRENEDARTRRNEWFADLQESLSKDYAERSMKGLSADFTVGESRAGGGVASWTMAREGSAWRLTVRGSQGQVRTAVFSEPDDARAQAHALLSSAVQYKSLSCTARQVGMKTDDVHHVCGVERTRDEAINNRAAFMASVVREAAAMEHRAVTVQAELARVHAAVEQFVREGTPAAL